MEQENWDTILINLGKVKEESKTRFTYKYIGKGIVKDIVPGCGGCTKIKSFKDNILTVEFDSGSIPKHLKESFKDGLPSYKGIVIEYEDGLKEKLTFTALIVK